MRDPQKQLRAEWLRVSQQRLVVLVRAEALILAKRITVLQVCEALQISPPTYRRLRRIHGLPELALTVVAEIDRTLRGVPGVDASTSVEQLRERITAGDLDLENALLGVGVVRKRG